MTKRTVELTKTFKQPTEKVWRFLTEQEKLSRWFLPNNFSLSKKDKFKLWTTPTPSWDGVLHGKIQSYEKNKSLSYELNTSNSSEKSYVDWRLEKGDGCSHLNLTHQGSDVLLETIYKAINGTQVSGHINREKFKQATLRAHQDKFSSDKYEISASEKAFLDTIRLQILRDPEKIEDAITQTILSYPTFLDQIIQLAVSEFPEKGMKILKAAKTASGANLQRLLGVTLFLFLFKDLLKEAEASGDSLIDLDDDDASDTDDLLPDPNDFVYDSQGNMTNKTIREVFAFVSGLMFLFISEATEADASDQTIIDVGSASTKIEDDTEAKQTETEELLDLADVSETNEVIIVSEIENNAIQEEIVREEIPVEFDSNLLLSEDRLFQQSKIESHSFSLNNHSETLQVFEVKDQIFDEIDYFESYEVFFDDPDEFYAYLDAFIEDMIIAEDGEYMEDEVHYDDDEEYIEDEAYYVDDGPHMDDQENPNEHQEIDIIDHVEYEDDPDYLALLIKEEIFENIFREIAESQDTEDFQLNFHEEELAEVIVEEMRAIMEEFDSPEEFIQSRQGFNDDEVVPLEEVIYFSQDNSPIDVSPEGESYTILDQQLPQTVDIVSV